MTQFEIRQRNSYWYYYYYVRIPRPSKTVTLTVCRRRDTDDFSLRGLPGSLVPVLTVVPNHDSSVPPPAKAANHF
eukprot:3454607-Rhodomonas_salina.1